MKSHQPSILREVMVISLEFNLLPKRNTYRGGVFLLLISMSAQIVQVTILHENLVALALHSNIDGSF